MVRMADVAREAGVSVMTVSNVLNERLPVGEPTRARVMAAVEALGSVTVICSDKTGTLTRNEMTARTVVTARHIYDVTGAGDTVIATLTLALASGASLGEAARVANVAGGLVVQKPGTATVTADELLAELGG